MAKLLNHENAFIALEKLTEYCLNENHPYGKEKAAVFKSALGIGIKDAELLKKEILKELASCNCIEKEADQHGIRFGVLMQISIFGKTAIVSTGWIFKNGEDFPRLTSCYVKKMKNEK